MEDRCFFQITFRAEDRERFLSFMNLEGRFSKEERTFPGALTASEEEANYYHAREIEALGREGLPFYGSHGGGSDYPAGIFAAAGGEYVECEAGWDFWPVVSIGQNGSPVKREVRVARDYWRLYKKARSLILGPTKN